MPVKPGSKSAIPERNGVIERRMRPLDGEGLGGIQGAGQQAHGGTAVTCRGVSQMA
jgi:hypothetical protein